MSDKGKGQGRKHDDSAKRNKQQEVEHRQPGPQGAEQAKGAAAGAYQRVSASPPSARLPKDILTLQRTAGNRAVTQLLQAKLTVGPVGDKYEQEADRTAEQVLRMPDPGGAVLQESDGEAERVHPFDGAEAQRHESPERGNDFMQARFLPGPPLAQPFAGHKLKFIDGPKAQRLGEMDDEDEMARMKPDMQRVANDGSFDPGGNFQNQLTSTRGAGQPLAKDVRSFMEPRFGADFNKVRVHTDSNAVQMNRQIKAQAFTHGSDIYMGAGKFNAGTTGGKRLLAHELTHTIQQGAAPVKRQLQHSGGFTSNNAANRQGDRFRHKYGGKRIQTKRDTGPEPTEVVGKEDRDFPTSPAIAVKSSSTGEQMWDFGGHAALYLAKGTPDNMSYYYIHLHQRGDTNSFDVDIDEAPYWGWPSQITTWNITTAQAQKAYDKSLFYQREFTRSYPSTDEQATDEQATENENEEPQTNWQKFKGSAKKAGGKAAGWLKKKLRRDYKYSSTGFGWRRMNCSTMAQYILNEAGVDRSAGLILSTPSQLTYGRTKRKQAAGAIAYLGVGAPVMSGVNSSKRGVGS